MGVEAAVGAELLGAELLGAEALGAEVLGGEVLGGEILGGGLAGEALGMGGEPFIGEALGFGGEPFIGEALAPAAEAAYAPAAFEAGADAAAAEAAGVGGGGVDVAPSWADISQAAAGVPFSPADYRTGLEALSQVSGLPYAGSVADTALQTALGTTVGEAPFDIGEFLGKYGKYGLPLATGVLGAAQAQGLQRQARALRRDLGTLPGATKAGQVGEQMVTAAQAGALPPGQEFQLQQAERAERARLEAYLSRAGISNSSSAESFRNQITQKYANIKEASVGRYLNQGLQIMGISDQATAAAIRAGYAADQNAANLMQRYASAATQMIPGVYRPAVAASQVA